MTTSFVSLVQQIRDLCFRPRFFIEDLETVRDLYFAIYGMFLGKFPMHGGSCLEFKYFSEFYDLSFGVKEKPYEYFKCI